jgi:glycosyltransferase involved in cell wall biosynthesis
MSARPRLLFLCQTLPYPPDGGVWIRSYHVLRLLSRAFDVTALCFERIGRGRRDGPAVGRDLEALGCFGRVEVFPIPQLRSRLRFGVDHLRSLLTRRVYTRYLYDSAAFRARLAQLLRGDRFALIHVDSLDLAAYLPLCAGHPVACVHHNVESVLLRRRAEIEGGWLRPAYLRVQARLQEEEERTWSPRVDLNVMVSDEDAKLLARIAPAARLIVAPNGVDLDEFRPEAGDERGIVFVGGTSWRPNLDALEYFCQAILPQLRAAGAELPIRWVGSASSEEQRHYRSRYGVELTGYVEDVRPYIRDSICNIVPLRVGGGTRLKILNAWAMGKAVVSTRIGCEGLAAVDGENALVRDEPAAFAGAILELTRDAGLRRRLGLSGRRTAECSYGWEVIGPRMVEPYLALARREDPDRATA